MQLSTLLSKARSSRFSRWLLNMAINRSVPFNRPHGFKVEPMPEGGIRVNIPFWRINHNHIRGIHACAIATASEMCSGLSLLERLDPKEYRLIMRTLQVEYHYQAKQKAVAKCTPTAAEIEGAIMRLKSGDATDFMSTVEVHDAAGNHLATAAVTWQVKEWSKVRTKR